MQPNRLLGIIFLFCMALSACQAPSLDISKVKAVSKLASLEVKLDKMLFAQNQSKVLPFLFGGINLNKAPFIAYTEASILIGIDMDKLRGQDIDISGAKISLTLPPVELLDFSYPAEKFREDDIYVTAKDTWSMHQKEQVYQLGELEIREMIPYLGMEEKAQENIIMLLTPVLRGMGFENIEINFQEDKDSDFLKREESIEALREMITG